MKWVKFVLRLPENQIQQLTRVGSSPLDLHCKPTKLSHGCRLVTYNGNFFSMKMFSMIKFYIDLVSLSQLQSHHVRPVFLMRPSMQFDSAEIQSFEPFQAKS